MKNLLNIHINNDITLSKILNKYIDINNINLLKFIDKGSNGEVFELTNNFVLKISEDEKEYFAYKKLLDLLKNSNENEKWINNIVILPNDLCIINEYNDYNDKTYYIILEKLFNISNIEKNLLYEILNFYYVDGIEELDFSNEDEEYYMLELDDIFKKFEKYIDIKKFMRFLFNIVEFSFEYEFYDIHEGNIMKNSDGEYKLIDLRIEHYQL